MFRAAYRSPSGAPNCICCLWFIYPCGVRSLYRLGGNCPLSAWTTADHHMGYITRGCKYSSELLLMSGMPLETCRAFNKFWNDKFYYKVVSCWLFLLIHIRNCQFTGAQPLVNTIRPLVTKSGKYVE